MRILNEGPLQDFERDWKQAMFSTRRVESYHVLFINPITDTLFASRGAYTRDIAKLFAEDIVTESRGKVVFMELLLEPEYLKRYRVAKSLSNGLDIVLER